MHIFRIIKRKCEKYEIEKKSEILNKWVQNQTDRPNFFSVRQWKYTFFGGQMNQYLYFYSLSPSVYFLFRILLGKKKKNGFSQNFYRLCMILPGVRTLRTRYNAGHCTVGSLITRSFLVARIFFSSKSVMIAKIWLQKIWHWLQNNKRRNKKKTFENMSIYANMCTIDSI